MTRIFLTIALLVFSLPTFASTPITITENFSTLTNIDTPNTSLTVVTAAANRGVKLPFVSSFEDLGYTGTSPLTTYFTSNGHVLRIAYGDNMFLVGGPTISSVGRIVSYDGSTFHDRSGNSTDQVKIAENQNFNEVIYGGGAFYLSNTANAYLAKYIVSGAAPDYTLCWSFLNSFDTGRINAMSSNGSSTLIGGSIGKLNMWDGNTSPVSISTTAINLSSAFNSTGSFPVTETVTAIANDGSNWLIGGTNGYLVKYDGSTFTNLTTISNAYFGTSTIKTIAWNGSEFLIGATGGKLAKYYNGAIYSSTSSVTSSNGGCFGASDINAIEWNGSEWIIGGAAGRLCLYDPYTSSTSVTSPAATDFTSLGTNTGNATKVTLLSAGWGNNSINALRWSGSTLLVGGNYSHLDKVTGFYNGAAQKSILSNKVNSTTDRMYSVALNGTVVTNAQSIGFSVSVDGGKNWQAIQNNNSATIISNTGFDLRWRADMSGTWRTPKLSSLSLTYLTVSPAVIPAGLGGDIYFSDNKTKVTIPPGLFSVDTSVTFTSISPSPVSSQPPATAVLAFEIKAEDSASGGLLTDFSKPVSLTLFAASSGGIVNGTSVLTANAASSLAVAYWNGLHWVPLSTQVTLVDGTGVYLTAKTSHLSKFGVVVASPNINVSVEPNPFTPGSSNTVFNRTRITFPNSDLISSVSLKIWDRNGSLIREYGADGVSQIEWDGKDSGGAIVESGVYFFEAIAGGTSRARGTVVVGR